MSDRQLAGATAPRGVDRVAREQCLFLAQQRRTAYYPFLLAAGTIALAGLLIAWLLAPTTARAAGDDPAADWVTGAMAAAAPWMDTGDTPNDRFGTAVTIIGDVNGDGYDDVAVGATGANSAAGGVFVYYGAATGPSVAPDVSLSGEAANDQYGFAVTGAGDLNNDGYADLAVGAYNHDGAGVDAGSVYLYYGSAAGLQTASPTVLSGETAGAWFGFAVAGAGDVNNDGYADLIIGAQRHTGATSNPVGKAYVYLGSAEGLNSSPQFMVEGTANREDLGVSVAGAGDVNGDGYDDVLIGATGNDDAGADAGKIWLYYGGMSGVETADPFTANGESFFDQFGAVVAGIDDINGDTYADFVVVAEDKSGFTTGKVSSGKVYLYLGSETGPVQDPFTLIGGQSQDLLGFAIGPAGDTNGDEYNDMFVTARGVLTDTGQLYIYEGGAAGLNAGAVYTVTGDNTNDLFGFAAAGGGDVNGDGFGDVLAGATGNDEGGNNAGKAYIFFDTANNRRTADLTMAVTADVADAKPGDTVVYTLSYSNTGQARAFAVQIENAIPTNLENVAVTSTGAAISDSGASPSYVWDVADLQPGQGGVITVTGRVKESAIEGNMVSTATITGKRGRESANNQDSASVMVEGDSGLYLPLTQQQR